VNEKAMANMVNSMFEEKKNALKGTKIDEDHMKCPYCGNICYRTYHCKSCGKMFNE